MKEINGKARRIRPLSLPLAWAFVALGAVMLGWLGWNREALTPWELFSGTAFVAFCVGGIVAAIFRNID